MGTHDLRDAFDPLSRAFCPTAYSLEQGEQSVIEPNDQWGELIGQVKAYMEILHAGGLVYAEGQIEPISSRPAPKANPSKTAPPRTPPTSGLSPEAREALKAALTDPYGHLGAPPLLASSPAEKPSPARSKPSSPPAQTPPGQSRGGKTKLVTLRDRIEGAKLIAEAKDLDRIRYLVSGCHMCALAQSRAHTVPGEGNPRAALMFIGEGPGYNEDMQGKPFVGRAGELLSQMILAMGLRREDVFIANIVKCRPPGNRDPLPDEITACSPFLKRQLELIRPKIICALGRIAIQGLLKDTTPITHLRGKWRTYQNIPLMPTFHPAYLLRSPGEKRKSWEDLKAIMARMADLKDGG